MTADRPPRFAPPASGRLIGSGGLRRDLPGYIRRLDRVWSARPEREHAPRPEPCTFAPQEPDFEP